MFIIAILATVYCFFTFLIFHTWGYTPLWVALLDLCFMIVFIAADVIMGEHVVSNATHTHTHRAFFL